jgi:hypothetical protein
MRADADDTAVARHLEVCLLWLFGYVMFYGSKGDQVSRFLIPHSRVIANAPLDAVPVP